MDVISLSTLLKPLAVIVRAASPYAKKMHAERSSGQSPFSRAQESDPLDKNIEGALQRLGAIQNHSKWWEELLSTISAQYTRPEFFQKPCIREWLGERQVKEDFKFLTRARLIGNNADQEILERLRQRYSDKTFDAAYQANYAIAVVRAVLIASTYSTFKDGDAVFAGMLRDASLASEQRDRTQSEKLDTITSQLLPSDDALHGKILQRELNKFLCRRGIYGCKPIDEIEALLSKTQAGMELCRAPNSDKAKVLYWVARCYVSEPDNTVKARSLINKYRDHPCSESEDVKFLEAWLDESTGDRKEAIKKLADLDSPESRSSLLMLISKQDNDAEALSWLSDFEPYDHNLLTPIGWRNAAVILCNEKRWPEAIQLLSTLPKEIKESFPELLFIHGIVHASLLLPEPIRPQLFESPYIDFKADVQEGEEAIHNRTNAITLLQQAKSFLQQLGAVERMSGCDYHLTWLRLTDPNVHIAARNELAQNMLNGEHAAFILDIALNFDIPFDREPLQKYLRRRKREGSLTAHDHIVRFLLLQHYGSSDDVLKLLEEEAVDLISFLPPVTLTQIKIDALLKADRIPDAENEIEQHSDLFSTEELERLRLMIASKKGEDLKELETLYSRTGEYIDLQNLVRYFKKNCQWQSLVPHAKTLLSLRRSSETLLTLIQAMQLSLSPSKAILAYIFENQDLIIAGTKIGDELSLCQTYALAKSGHYLDALPLVEELAKRTHNPNAISLEIQISLKLGRWEHFPTIIDREYSNLNDLPPQLLIQMATAIADSDRTRAIEILNIAAEIAPEDAAIQINAYSLATQLGLESDVSECFNRMMWFAEQDDGPIKTISLSEIAEMMPSHSNERRDWWRQYIEGDISLHAASSFLSTPVAHLLIGHLLSNENEIDTRKRSVLPIRHGGRGQVELKDIKRVAFDYSSLLLLEHLGVTNLVFDSLERIYVSPRLMDIIFTELRQVRFHQPSRVDEAKRVLALVTDGIINKLCPTNPPKELINKVGEEMAELLHSAKLNGGRVLATLPIHKAGSLVSEEADLESYGPFILKTTQFLSHIENQLPLDKYELAKSFLQSVDRGAPLGAEDIGNGPIYIDDLALKYLDSAHLTNQIRYLNNEIFIESSTDKDAKELIQAAVHGENIALVLSNLRRQVSTGVQSGKIVIMPGSNVFDNNESFLLINGLKDILYDLNNVDVVCIDDRSIGRSPAAADKSGNRTPLVGCVDILKYLSAKKVLTLEQKQSYDYRLLKGGVSFLPIDSQELFGYLKESCNANPTTFREHRQLIAFRQNIQRIRSMKILRLPEERAWTFEIVQASKELLSLIWKDAAIITEMAEKMSNWTFNSLAPLP